MKTILREMQTTSPDFPDFSAQMNLLALSVIRFRNTLDFLITRFLGKRKLHGLTPLIRNSLRAALYEVRWLGTSLDVSFSRYPILKTGYIEVVQRANNANLNDLVKDLPRVNRLSLLHSHPSFLVKQFLEHLSPKDSAELMITNNQNRYYYIRPNKLFKHHESVLESLTDVQLVRDPDVPEVSRIVEGVDTVVKSQSFKDGRILIQDKASVVTVNALDPQPNQKIWDACAAPGMKTQLIAEKMQGRGELIATDIYKDRLNLAKARSRQLNVDITRWIHADASKAEILDADKVLIDAPCTSTGVLQAYPSFKWRLNKETLFDLMTVQNKILDGILTAYSDRSGTEIVFSTCSLLPHEGESQIDSAMKQHDVELMQLPEYGDSGYSGFDCSELAKRLFPHRHNCSGFFIAKLKIKH
jgi:16S rRNA (cytosine967-C5)-methyltransferase